MGTQPRHRQMELRQNYLELSSANRRDSLGADLDHERQRKAGDRDSRGCLEDACSHRKRQIARRKLPGFQPDKEESMDALLFTRPDGKPIYAQRDRQAIVNLVFSIKNLPKGMTVDTLRHVATAAMIEEGADKETLIAMMGWSPKNADAQLATYSSADNARRASKVSISYVDSFYGGK